MKKPIKAIFTCLGIVFFFLFVQILSGAFVGIYYGIKSAATGTELNPDDIQTAIMSQIHLMIIINYFITSIIMYLIFIIRKVKVWEYVSFKKFSINKLPSLLCYALGLQFISSYIIHGIDHFYSLDASYDKMAHILEGNNQILVFIALVIVAPIVEEILFRGIILTKLKNHLNIKAAIVIQAALFGIIHLNMAQLIPTFLMGLILGYLYINENNIFAPIVFHIFFNAYALLVTSVSVNIQTYLTYVLWASAVISLILIVRAWQNNKQETKGTGSSVLPAASPLK